MLSCLGLFAFGLCSPVFGQAPLADPTRPAFFSGRAAGGEAAQALNWRLTSTLIASKRRVAIINNQPVQIGQIVDGAVLLAVDSDSALLRRDGEKIRLDLNADTVKRAVRPLH